MTELTKKIRYFFFGQNFSDGIRVTFAILIPTLVFSYFDKLATGLTISLGALCISIVDMPGPVTYKRNAMLYCNIFVFLTAIVTGFARENMYILGLEILFFSFFFSMFNVFGNRAASVGTASLLIMILMMERELKPAEVLPYSLMILAGGLWYTGVSLIFSELMPYRPAQRALGECIRETARFLSVKSEFYDTSTDLDTDYRNLMTEQVKVSEKQNAVRELLFKSRQIMRDSMSTGRMLVVTFIDLVDIYEQITAMYYDYAMLRNQFGHTGILEKIHVITGQLAEELDGIGVAIQSNMPYRNKMDISRRLTELRNSIENIQGDSLVLKKIFSTLQELDGRLKDMQKYTALELPDKKKTKDIELARFAPSQSYNLQLFRDNLSIDSSVFRHSLRMALVSLFGFAVAKMFAFGHHGYWVLLTILVILKPGFSLTKQRNFDRLVGTIAGALIGVVILLSVSSLTMQLILLVFFMIGTYSFMRSNYILMVTLMTPYILILFNLLGIGKLNIVEERILDTLIGSAIAFAASYMLLPSWESQNLKSYMQNLLKAELAYLDRLADILSGKIIPVNEYKLVRKDVYVSSANLSAAFQRMVSEPKSKQVHKEAIHQFVVLNHILVSNIATLASDLMSKPVKVHSHENISLVKQAAGTLTESAEKLGTEYRTAAREQAGEIQDIKTNAGTTADELLLNGQLAYIKKICSDICRVAAGL